jgi:hypothetical protein
VAAAGNDVLQERICVCVCVCRIYRVDMVPSRRTLLSKQTGMMMTLATARSLLVTGTAVDHLFHLFHQVDLLIIFRRTALCMM